MKDTHTHTCVCVCVRERDKGDKVGKPVIPLMVDLKNISHEK